jgi:hypothetical protein
LQIRDNPAGPSEGVVYRCHACRLDLVLDHQSRKLTPTVMHSDNTSKTAG